MNHNRLILNVISRYEHAPSIQRDMRRIVKYCESMTRMALTPIFKGELTKIALEVEQLVDDAGEHAELLENVAKCTLLAVDPVARPAALDKLRASLKECKDISPELYQSACRITDLSCAAIEEQVSL